MDAFKKQAVLPINFNHAYGEGKWKIWSADNV